MSDHFRVIKTPILEIAYLEYGKSDGKPIILLHGWPDGPLTWKEIVPRLVHEGFRVLVPTLRGFGQTRADKRARTGLDRLCRCAWNRSVHAGWP